jgi:hypothetical protein
LFSQEDYEVAPNMVRFLNSELPSYLALSLASNWLSPTKTQCQCSIWLIRFNWIFAKVTSVLQFCEYLSIIAGTIDKFFRNATGLLLSAILSSYGIIEAQVAFAQTAPSKTVYNKVVVAPQKAVHEIRTTTSSRSSRISHHTNKNHRHTSSKSVSRENRDSNELVEAGLDPCEKQEDISAIERDFKIRLPRTSGIF